jgi:lipopolysaccharide transport system permease protein
VIALGVLVGLMAYYGIGPGWEVLTLPLFTLLAAVAALAVGTPLAALNVRYRDVRYTIPFLAQILLFVTPVAYATSLVPDRWRIVYSLNPIVGVVDGFRWALLGAGGPPGGTLAVSVVATLALLVPGLLVFRRMEKTFADIV